MPLFAKRRRHSKPTILVSPAICQSSPPPSYQYLYGQQPSGVPQTYQVAPYAPHCAFASTSYLPSIPSLQRHDRSSQAVPGYTSCTNLATTTTTTTTTHHSELNRNAEYWNIIGDKFSDVISLIDEEVFPQPREVIFTLEPTTCLPPSSSPQHAAYLSPENTGTSNPNRSLLRLPPAEIPRSSKSTPQAQPTRINVLSKVNLYSNSRLYLSLPPLRLYTPTYPIICLAAQYSNTAYATPCTLSRSERTSLIEADARLGTKAMVLKSIPIDDMNTIVFAIRGTSFLSLRDWGINLNTDPEAPTRFLDDEGNLCHKGFLKVARAMVKPIANRLRTLLEENPSRASCSLVITGHSAGGAVAALLYAHMVSTSASTRSELNILTGCFKRVHCVTFGAPPISLLPLAKPDERRLQKSVFLSFVNEGDIVARAEMPYMLSLAKLLVAPVPKKSVFGQVWRVPEASLSLAGRVVLLRIPERNSRGLKGTEEDVTANVVMDSQLRGLVWGDLPCHAMGVYAQRVERLAVRRVTGKG